MQKEYTVPSFCWVDECTEKREYNWYFKISSTIIATFFNCCLGLKELVLSFTVPLFFISGQSYFRCVDTADGFSASHSSPATPKTCLCPLFSNEKWLFPHKIKVVYCAIKANSTRAMNYNSGTFLLCATWHALKPKWRVPSVALK